jgi:AraC-like DNA-binding protein
MKSRKTDASLQSELVYELRSALAQSIALRLGSAEKMTTAVPGLSLAQRTGPTAPCAVTYQPGLIVMAQGRKRVELGSNTFIYDESRYLLTSLDLPTVSQVVEASKDRPALAFALKLELPMVREILTREDVPIPELPPDSPAITTAEITAELLSACCRLMDLLDTPQHIPFLSGLIQREIIYHILQGAEGARLRAIATLGEQSHRIAQAITWLKSNYEKPLRVEELAQMARMGVSTFHHHFREMTAMSPVQYQKQLRLQAARTRMLTDGFDASSAAIEVGYESVSQFNREYSRLFGQPPMRDIRARRSTGALELESVSVP